MLGEYLPHCAHTPGAHTLNVGEVVEALHQQADRPDPFPVQRQLDVAGEVKFFDRAVPVEAHIYAPEAWYSKTCAPSMVTRSVSS